MQHEVEPSPDSGVELNLSNSWMNHTPPALSRISNVLQSTKSFWLTFGAVASILLVISPIFASGNIAIPDEGVYSAQAAAIAGGSWKQIRPAADVIDEPLLDPLAPSVITGDKRIPYSRHPLYSVIAGTAYRVAGLNGLILVSTLGGILAILGIAILCRQFNRSYAIPALLVTSIASPILFNSYVVNAHNLATALAVVTIIASLRCLSDCRTHYIAMLFLASLSIPMFRTEGGVFLLALSFSLSLLGIAPRRVLPDKFSRINAISSAICVGIAACIGFILDLTWAGSIAPQGGNYASPGKAIGGSQTSFISGFWSGLLQPWQSVLLAFPTVAVILILVALGAFSLRFAPRFTLLPVSSLLLAAASSLYLMFTIRSLVYGLFAAMPVGIFAVISLSRAQLKSERTLVLILVFLTGVTALTITIYGDGGSAQWGGRLFQVLLPAIIPLALIGVHNAIRGLSDRIVVLVLSSLMIISLGMGAASLRQNLSMRDKNRDFVLGVSATVTSSTPTDTEAPPRVVTLLSVLRPGGASRAFWSTDVKLNLLYVPIQVLPSLANEADFSGYDEILLITDDLGPTLDPLIDSLSRSLSRKVDEVPVDSRISARAFVFSRNNGL